MTFQIQSPATQQTRPHQTNSHRPSASEACFDCARRSCEWWTGPRREVRRVRASGLTSGPACREMARSADPRRRTRFARVGTRTCPHMRAGMCSFSNRWQRSGDWREKTEDTAREGGGQSVVPPSPRLVFMTFAFYLPLTTARGPKRGKSCFYLSPDGGLIL